MIEQVSKSMPEPSTAPIKRTKYVHAACELITGNIHSYQTGVFPVTSISGNKYIFMMYDEDANYIDVIPIPSCTQHQILRAYKRSNSMLKSRVLKPRL